MRTALNLACFLSAALTAIAFVATPAAANNMMAACAPDIASMCSDVREGRGRITACLVSHREKLSAACGPEVEAVAAGGSRLTPKGARAMMAPGFSAPLPASCTADAGKYCNGVQAGDGRIFACLYARSDRVSKTCSADSKSVLDGAS